MSAILSIEKFPPKHNEDVLVKYQGLSYCVRAVRCMNDTLYWYLVPDNPLIIETRTFMLDLDVFPNYQKINCSTVKSISQIDFDKLEKCFIDLKLNYPCLGMQTLVFALTFPQIFRLQKQIEEFDLKELFIELNDYPFFEMYLQNHNLISQRHTHVFINMMKLDISLAYFVYKYLHGDSKVIDEIAAGFYFHLKK